MCLVFCYHGGDGLESVVYSRFLEEITSDNIIGDLYDRSFYGMKKYLDVWHMRLVGVLTVFKD